MDKKRLEFSFLSPAQKQKAISEIIGFFATERDQEIGVIAAEEVLDMLLETAGADIYNKGVDDTKTLLKKRLEEVEIDIDATLKKTR
jgi:uncharacterized protein (DUF2164 family)